MLALLLACWIPNASDVAPTTDDSEIVGTDDSTATDDSDSEVPLDCWLDADGDGFGVDEPAPCSTGAEEQGDCDDSNAAIHPGADEVCNAVDDDCDGAVDQGTTVGVHFASLTEALNAVDDGATICLGPGEHQGAIVDGFTDLILEGSGPEATTLTYGGPVLTVQNAEVLIRNLQISRGEAESGAGLWMDDAFVDLVNVVVRGNACNEDTCEGTGIWAQDTQLSLDQVRIEDNAQRNCVDCSGAGVYVLGTTHLRATDTDFEGNIQQGRLPKGAGLAARYGEITLQGVRFIDHRITIDVQGGGLNGGALYTTDTPFSLTDVTVSGTAIDADLTTVSNFSIWGGGVYLHANSGTIDGLEITDTTATHKLDMISNGLALALRDLSAQANDVHVHGNSANATEYLGYAGTVLIKTEVGVSGTGWRVTGNTAGGSDAGTSLFGGAIYAPGIGEVTLSQSIFADNLLQDPKGECHGGALWAGNQNHNAAMLLSNVIVAGNRLDCATSSGAGVQVDNNASLDLSYSDVVGNSGGSGVQAYRSLEMHHVNVVGNSGWGVELGAEATFGSVQYNDVWDNGAGRWSRLDPTDDGLNVSVDPFYVDLEASLAVDWDLHLEAGSFCRDVGGGTDADGSEADIGSYGGPDGNW